MTDALLECLRGVFGGSTPLMILTSVVFLIIGFIGLIKGADMFVDGASQIAAKLKIPLIVIGLTIVAFGTSAPEAAISISAAVKDAAGISIGNVIGSNILNILVILGISALVCKLPVKKTTFIYEIPFVVVITVVLLLLGIFGGAIEKIDGVILAVLFALFFVYLIWLSKKGKASADDVPEIDGKASVLKMILFVVIGLVMIVLGSQLTVTGATEIAETLGVSERIIGLTIVAFGTSLPELVTSVAAARKGKTDIAVGNIIGSNIFNILFVVGASALISPNPIVFEQAFIIDSIVAIAAAVLLWVLFLNKKKELGKTGGIIMLVGYAGYCVYLFM